MTAELPRLVRALATGDLDGDGTRELAPIASLQVGIVTSDMGTAGFGIPTCDRGTFGHMYGDDGVLITRGRTAIEGCNATYPSIHQFMASGPVSPDAFATDVSCVATTGTGGCGFEQQLEAVLKAVSPDAPTAWTIPDYDPPLFFAGTRGHAIGMNAGFVRPGSILATLVVTDEEDCSIADPELVSPGSSRYEGDLNLRCFRYPEAQQPVTRFVTGLRGLRRDPRRLVVSVIAGIPVDLSGDTPAEYDAILADGRMQERIDPSTGTTLVPSCNVPGRGIAFPPRRIVSVARGLDAMGAQTTVESICRASFRPAIDALVLSIGSAAVSCP